MAQDEEQSQRERTVILVPSQPIRAYDAPERNGILGQLVSEKIERMAPALKKRAPSWSGSLDQKSTN